MRKVKKVLAFHFDEGRSARTIGEHPVRTVCAGGVVLGVTLWNEVAGARPLRKAFSVTPNIDAEDAVSGGGQGSLQGGTGGEDRFRLPDRAG